MINDKNRPKLHAESQSTNETPRERDALTIRTRLDDDEHDRPPPSTAALRINRSVQPPRTQASPSLQTPLRARGGDAAAQVAQQRRSLVYGPDRRAPATEAGLARGRLLAPRILQL